MRTTFFLQRFVILLSIVAVFIMNIGMVYAQDVKAQHLDSARKMIKVIQATDQFNNFLPSAAYNLKSELINDDPNLATIISEIVDKQALTLAKRRADLEEEIAHVYVKHFSQEELDTIAAFYNSAAGKKFLTEVPNVARDSYSVFDKWRSTVMQDLVKNVEKEMVEVLGLNKSVTSKPDSSTDSK
ncbi:DUF2059 domain-containing protein [Bartonella sp. WD16.2]|uniref:DUF2059 domain-containing protein n=1 Tax=Bartonella sp. WD16.2 TaxID=1933904 RepID=UPI00099B05CA|nr:DUF2059 domain-containing protein [Bartonella sp. WD16.2]AQX19582.1 hypothetical protein BWD162_004540 [Bartonella sp. WD16.2]